MEEFCTWFTSSFRLDKFNCFSRFFIHKKIHRRSGIELSFINMAAGASSITRSQEYISFRSSVPLKRVSKKAVHIHTIFTKFIAQNIEFQNVTNQRFKYALICSRIMHISRAMLALTWSVQLWSLEVSHALIAQDKFFSSMDETFPPYCEYKC